VNEKEKILSFASEKFMRDGFYKVTMDEIAHEMRISKKTIYKHFSSKQVLVEVTVESLMHKLKNSLSEITDQNFSAIEKLNNSSSFLIKAAFQVSDKWLSDLKLHSQHLWEKVDKFRKVTFISNFSKIVDQGKREGTIVDKPNILIITIMLAAIRSVINPDFLLNNNISAKQAGKIAFDIIISGILTKKGRKLNKQFKLGKP